MKTYQLPNITTGVFTGKRVLVRLDTDVPLSQTREIEDDIRLVCGQPTIDYLLSQNATVIVCGHLGRPNGEIKNELSLEPVATWFHKRVTHNDVRLVKQKIDEFDGWKISETLYLLENLRFNKGEEENSLEFSRKLASVADYYVNEAFAVSHRAHASMVGVAKVRPHFAGIRLQEEVTTLTNATTNPKRPLVVIIGGAKLETKLPLVSHMANIADTVLVGGKIASEKQKIVGSLSESKNASKVIVGDLNTNLTDITQKSVDFFREKIQTAQTIIWNGPVGRISNLKSQISNGAEDSEKGTREVARAIASSNAYTIIGGGDTLEFLKRENLSGKFSFESSGGGAMLTLLSGEELPALDVLNT